MSTRDVWWDETWNPIAGCTPISPGCEHRYAERMAVRQCRFADGGERRGLDPDGSAKYKCVIRKGKWRGTPCLDLKELNRPGRWKKSRRIFVCTMEDLFHELSVSPQVDDVFATAELCPQHTFMILTKRAERMMQYLCKPARPGISRQMSIDSTAAGLSGAHCYMAPPWPLPNVWLGTTVENQQTADERIPHLLKCPAALRFLSLEPLLEPVDLGRHLMSCVGCGNQGSSAYISNDPKRGLNLCSQVCIKGGEWPSLDWVIVGGETGPGARPMEADWARSIRDQCKAAGVPFFFKGMGGGRVTPDDLMIREFPAIEKDREK